MDNKMFTIQPLIELQDVDGQVRQLEREMNDIPMQKEQEDAKLKGPRAALTEAKVALVNAKADIKKCDAEREGFEEKANGYRTQQATAKSNKEYLQLSLQINDLEGEISSAENRRKALEDSLPTLEAAVAKAQAALDEDSKGVNAYIAELDERLNAVKAEYATLQAQRHEIADKVDKKNLLIYSRLCKKRWPVLVELNAEGVCDGCHMKQPPAIAQEVSHKDHMVMCQMCGRILYREY